MYEEKDLRRFWSKVFVRSADDCWNWTAKSKIAGYGAIKMKLDGRWHQTRANRIALSVATGIYPPSSVYALHSCDNPLCCNPKHMRWGSQQDNVVDAWERGRASPPPIFTGDEHYLRRNPHWVKRGEKVHNARFTAAVIKEIHRLHALKFNSFEISKSIGFPQPAVYDVCRGKSWAHLHGEPGFLSLEELKVGGKRRGECH